MALNEKEQLFVQEYIICKGNAYQAALNAGYKPKTAKTAYEWLLESLPNPTTKRHLPYKKYLREAIDAELQKIHSEKTADEKEVIEYLTSVMRGENTEQTLRFVGEGVQKISNIDVGAKDRLKAAELIGKIYGLFTDKVNIEGTQKVVIVDDLEDV